MTAKVETTGRTILDDQVEAALEVWFEPNWSALVQLGAWAAPASGTLVEDARKRMRRALVAARRARPASWAVEI
jgi:hypothetical protein